MSARLAGTLGGMDVLGDVIGAMRAGRPHAALRTRGGPWGLHFPASAGVGFHAVLAGSCWLLPPGGGEPVQVSAGELVLLPHGRAYGLADHPATALVEFGSPAAERRQEREGTAGPESVLLCGAYLLDRERTHPLLGRLPEVVRLAVAGTPAGTVVELLHGELAGPLAGGGTAATALLDTALLYVLRAWYGGQDAVTGRGWAAALTDPAVGAALAALHEDPARAWTVAELGAAGGLSRAAFARRFSALVGEPPLAYLTWWRLTLAGRLLREGDEPLRAVARRTGYATEFALARAFKREYGTAPGRYRTERRAASAAAAARADGRAAG
ncbi:AraC family transcriptional regulator [Kitasatospora sp. NBC_01539]|uniref:AraC family transcriptional regulator n=1 Tax=Kitasatospora sp. NBC_01539 TaxID=2903577 RepID=UPI0038602E50